MPWLTIVIPTIGRADGLERTLESIERQAREDVEVLVVGDCHAPATPDALRAAHQVILRRSSRYRWMEYDGGQHCYGQPQRTYGGRQALGEWVAFSQDDNILTADALASIWRAVCEEPHKRPLFFRWLAPWRETIWRDKSLQLGNIDADCIMLPQMLAREVTWGLRYEGDFDAAADAMQRNAGDVGWRDELIAVARPGPEHIWWMT
jgi:glycosyltransferase involved in cell wall biosynthesis